MSELGTRALLAAEKVKQAEREWAEDNESEEKWLLVVSARLEREQAELAVREDAERSTRQRERDAARRLAEVKDRYAAEREAGSRVAFDRAMAPHVAELAKLNKKIAAVREKMRADLKIINAHITAGNSLAEEAGDFRFGKKRHESAFTERDLEAACKQ